MNYYLAHIKTLEVKAILRQFPLDYSQILFLTPGPWLCCYRLKYDLWVRVRFPLHSPQVSEGFQSDNGGGHLRRCKIENGDCSILISLREVFNIAI